ncbi:type III-A CRISPR-associated RAMP protein Csm4 [Aureivirga sp. CE67]|uniref:type III-A CRISPR-associated RAMP protein Csm4 n=1 Tax=Aureivirga sp. CE67 TaxID=1788983 RepID=UPI0018CA5CCB|nr:type III-A CRISPR-associated RAMP protein Csm4 [Aureivirga sp. CE67]
MKAIILKVRPNSRFHFGKTALDNEVGLSDTSDWMHSDSLFAALVQNIAKYAPEEIENFIQLFEKHKIKISSLFYCLKNIEKNEIHYLLPKPIHASNLVNEKSDSHIIKKVKRTKFVSLKFLQKNFDADTIENKDLPKPFEKGTTIQVKQRFFDSEDDKKDPYSISFIQIPKHTGKKHAKFETHFYFLYDENSLTEKEKNLFKFAVDLIRFEGLGGRKSSGFGFVEEVCFNTDFNYSFKSDTYMSLGLSIPESLDDLKKFNYYDTIKRGGRQRKFDYLKSIQMISEGAILNTSDFKGQVVELSKDDNAPSKRLGICLTLPIHENYGNS